MHKALLFALTFALVPLPALADQDEVIATQIEEMHGDLTGFNDAFGIVTTAMAEGDLQRLAAFADYPLLVHNGDNTYNVESGDDFVDNIQDYVTDETQQIVANQRYDQLFVNGDGVMFGDGAMWMARACDNDDCSEGHWFIKSISQ